MEFNLDPSPAISYSHGTRQSRWRSLDTGPLLSGGTRFTMGIRSNLVPAEPMRSRTLPAYLLQVGILLIVYSITAKLGLAMGAVGGIAAPVWPPTGIALAAISLFGYRLW